MTALLMDGSEPLGPALCHHSGRDPPGTSASPQAHYGIYRTFEKERPTVEEDFGKPMKSTLENDTWVASSLP